MKLSIVGTSHLTQTEEILAKSLIDEIISYNKPSVLITGDAEGIDRLVREHGNAWGKLKVYIAEDKKWEGDYGFRERNISIACEADKVISITTKLKNQPCYHCDSNHQRTGGCFTAKYARKLGKSGEVILLER